MANEFDIEFKNLDTRRVAIKTEYGIYAVPDGNANDELNDRIVVTHGYEDITETYQVCTADEAIANAAELLKGAGMLYQAKYGPEGQQRMMSKLMQMQMMNPRQSRN